MFNDITRKPLPVKDTFAGQSLLQNTHSLAIGEGAVSFKADQSGIWLGANVYADAPFSVDMNGNIDTATVDADILTVQNIDADNIKGDQLDVVAAKTGTLQVDETLTVGTTAGRVLIQGGNTRILINDGSDNRVVIGSI